MQDNTCNDLHIYFIYFGIIPTYWLNFKLYLNLNFKLKYKLYIKYGECNSSDGKESGKQHVKKKKLKGVGRRMKKMCDNYMVEYVCAATIMPKVR